MQNIIIKAIFLYMTYLWYLWNNSRKIKQELSIYWRWWWSDLRPMLTHIEICSRHLLGKCIENRVKTIWPLTCSRSNLSFYLVTYFFNQHDLFMNFTKLFFKRVIFIVWEKMLPLDCWEGFSYDLLFIQYNSCDYFIKRIGCWRLEKYDLVT